MDMKRVALAACRTAMQTAPAAQAEMNLLVKALRNYNVQGDVVIWGSQSVNWKSYSLVMICQTWDYIDCLTPFIEWCDRVSKVTKLFNSPAVVRWNSNKFYLEDLKAAGVRTMPSVLVKSKVEWNKQSLMRELFSRQWSSIVIKPTVGCDSDGVAFFNSLSDSWFEHAMYLMESGHDGVLIQPFVHSIKTHGEVSLIFVDGSYSHAVRKYVGPGEFRIQERFGGGYEPFEPTRDMLDTASSVISALRELIMPREYINGVLYVRVDLMGLCQNGYNLQWVVGEVEMVEPFLYLIQSYDSNNIHVSDESNGSATADKIAAAIVRRLNRTIYI
mmetsp:Transcript_1202/g.1960  ORF Transcript_1202/g.1960 Transcript_1202/m.1960 type:complete len:330 (-) Transcript_1202:14-1003(-)